MDLLRQILPQLVSSFLFLLVVWAAAFIIKRHISNDLKPKVFKVARWVTFATVFFIAIWVIKIASTNEVPRSVIDRSNSEHMVNDFDQRTKKQSKQPKQTTDTTPSSNQKND